MNRYCLRPGMIAMALALAITTATAMEPATYKMVDVTARASWLRRRPVNGPMSLQDVAARAELLRRLELDSDEEFGELVHTTIPELPTALPTSYDIAIYGSYVGSMGRCLIQVRDGKAIGEYQWAGGVRRRGTISADVVDIRVRQLVYASMARYEPIVANEPVDVGVFSSYMCTHVPYMRIDVVSRDPRLAWRLTTDARQTCGGIHCFNNGLRGYCHARLIEYVSNYAEDRWRDVWSEAEFADETRADLRNLAKHVVSVESLQENLRRSDSLYKTIVQDHDLDLDGAERARIDARILGTRALDAQLHIAKPLLEQIGPIYFTAPIRRMKSSEIAAPSRNAREPDDAVNQRAVGNDGGGQELLNRAHEFFDFGFDGRAAAALFDRASAPHPAEKRRQEIADLARDWLRRADERERSVDLLTLIASALGRFGNAEDVMLLDDWINHHDVTRRAAAIHGIVILDRSRALESARCEVARLLRNPPEEPALGEILDKYLDFFFWQRDAVAVDLIQQSIDSSRRARHEPDDWIRKFSVLSAYVRAADIDERLDWSFGYLRRSSANKLWKRDVVTQLQMEGADQDACRALLRLIDSCQTVRD